MEAVYFWDMLDRHDWTYTYADDARSYRNGSASWKEIQDVLKKHPEYQELFKQFEEYAWGRSKEKPTRPYKLLTVNYRQFKLGKRKGIVFSADWTDLELPGRYYVPTEIAVIGRDSTVTFRQAGMEMEKGQCSHVFVPSNASLSEVSVCHGMLLLINI